jgi:rhodanese-related sulfurtransferase
MACGTRITKDLNCDKTLNAISSVELKEFLHSHPNALIVDVREKYEQEVGEKLDVELKHLEMMPLSRIVNGFSEWIRPNNIEKPILFYCRSGNRSFQAASSLSQLGHKSIYHLAGGLALNVH